MSGAIRKLVLCGDFHCGSPRALMPPAFKTAEGNIVHQNTGQQWLWHHWQEWTNYIAAKTGGEPYALVLMGDLIEGIHHGSAEVVSAALEDHVSMACDVLGPLADEANKTYVLLGTESHTRNVEHAIARAIEAEPSPEGGAWRDITITVNGTPTFFTHHAGTSSRVYLAASRPGRGRPCSATPIRWRRQGTTTKGWKRCGRSWPSCPTRGRTG